MSSDIPFPVLDGDDITAALWNALQRWFLHSPEGDYTSYKYVWGRNYTGIADTSVFVYHVSNTGTVTFTDATEAVLYKKTYSGAESTSSGFDGIYTMAHAVGTGKSVLGTYYGFVHTDTSNTTIKIYKNDTLLQTIRTYDDDTAADLVSSSFLINFSPNGRYFACVGQVVGSNDNLYLMLYEADV